MKTSDKCGIYRIQCVVSGKSYIGSSRRIYKRWYEHRRALTRGVHTSPRLQRAWIKHGETNFVFSVLEECSVEMLFEREQFHIDAIEPDYNSMPLVRVVTPEMRRKMLQGMRLYKESITHCPKGHEYTPENTAISTRGARLCRQCNADRVAAKYAAETPEETAARLARGREYIARNRELKRQKAREYAAANRDKKRAYDKAYKARARAVGPPKHPVSGKDRVRAALAARGIIV